MHGQYLFTFSSSSFYHFSKSLETRLSNQWEINKLGMMGEGCRYIACISKVGGAGEAMRPTSNKSCCNDIILKLNRPCHNEKLV